MNQTIDVPRVVRYHDRPRVDLQLPLSVADHYRVFEEPDAPDSLQESVQDIGIRIPLRIYTNGARAVLRDGHHRLVVARRLGLETVPVQVVPNWLDRLYDAYELPEIEPLLAGWLEANPLFGHDGHDMVRTESNVRISSTVCSCGATWREEVSG